MKAKINEGCIGCSACASNCPEVFRMNDDGLAEVYGNVTDENLSDTQSAVDGCPVQVIELED